MFPNSWGRGMFSTGEETNYFSASYPRYIYPLIPPSTQKRAFELCTDNKSIFPLLFSLEDAEFVISICHFVCSVCDFYFASVHPKWVWAQEKHFWILLIYSFFYRIDISYLNLSFCLHMKNIQLH